MRRYVGFIVVWKVLVDYLLLMGTNRLTGGRCGGRLIPAALLGGIYTWLCLQHGFGFLGNDFWRWVFLGLSGMIAYGEERENWHKWLIYWILSLALEELATGFRWQILLPGGVAIWALQKLCRNDQQGMERRRIPLEIRYGKEMVRLTALWDTGNTLRDPITGELVLVIDAAAAQTLTGLTREQLGKPLETLMKAKLPGLRLIPYRSVGQPGGLLLALRFRDIKLGDKHTDAIIAMAPDSIGRGEGFRALAGGLI